MANLFERISVINRQKGKKKGQRMFYYMVHNMARIKTAERESEKASSNKEKRGKKFVTKSELGDSVRVKFDHLGSTNE
jgi:hypothetical protein